MHCLGRPVPRPQQAADLVGEGDLEAARRCRCTGHLGQLQVGGAQRRAGRGDVVTRSRTSSSARRSRPWRAREVTDGAPRAGTRVDAGRHGPARCQPLQGGRTTSWSSSSTVLTTTMNAPGGRASPGRCPRRPAQVGEPGRRWPCWGADADRSRGRCARSLRRSQWLPGRPASTPAWTASPRPASTTGERPRLMVDRVGWCRHRRRWRSAASRRPTPRRRSRGRTR